jgi:hypothetical protein
MTMGCEWAIAKEFVRCKTAAVLIDKASCYTAVAVTLYSLQ